MNEKVESYVVAFLACGVIIAVDKLGISGAGQIAIYTILSGIGISLPVKNVVRSAGVTTPPPEEAKQVAADKAAAK